MGCVGGDGLYGAVGEVEAGLLEVFVEEVADEVAGVAGGVADGAAVGVLPYVERQTRVVVVVEGAEGFVVAHVEAEARGEVFDGDGAEDGDLFLCHGIRDKC